jgi:acyl carrier protein
MIPYRMITKIAAIHLADKDINYRFTDSGAYYIEDIFEKIGHPFDLRIGLHNVAERNLVSAADVFEEVDMTASLPLSSERDIVLPITKDGEVSGFLVWLNLFTTPEIINDAFQSQKDFLPIYFPVFQPALLVKKGDLIAACVRMDTIEGDIYPDYSVRGELKRQDGEIIAFSYTSKRLPGKYPDNEFYRRLFSNERIQVQEPFSTQDLHEYLRSKLPEYMLPSVLVELEKLPLTHNGKIDRKALLSNLMERTEKGTEYIAPRNEIEEKLAIMWQEILGKERVGIKDNFFTLGGHSLKATRLISKIKKEFGIKIDLQTFFLEPTIEILADKIINDTWLQSSLPEKGDGFDEVKI